MGLLFRGGVWFGLYCALLLLPLAVALVADPIGVARPLLVEFSVALGFVAFALIAVEFTLVSRLRAASEPFGTDALMLFHRQMGLAAAAFVALHVAALLGPGAREELGMRLATHGVGASGAVAVVALVVLVITSVWRRPLGLRYERWQGLHVVAAITIVAATLFHLLGADRYTGTVAVRAVVLLYVALLAVLLLRYRVLRPLRLRRRPCRVLANRDEGADTRTLVLQPSGWRGFVFEPGQFGCLVTGRGPLTGGQHPISFSAERQPGDPFEMSIKALGDWSGTVVPRIAPGTTVWVDGPFGALTPDRTPAQGFVLIAGGVGITPMRSILCTLRDRRDPRHVVLIHAASRPERMLFSGEIEALRGAVNLEYVRVYEAPPAGWRGESGLVTRELLARHLPAQYRHCQFFVCGPPPMMDRVEAGLLALGVPPERIATERFDMIREVGPAMTHVIVTRVSFALCVLLLVCAALFAVLAAPASAPVTAMSSAEAGDPATRAASPAGAVLFDRYCARCHEAAAIAAALRGDDRQAGTAAAQMRAFLRQHGTAGDAEDAAIVAYLRTRVD